MPRETSISDDALLRWHGLRPTPQRVAALTDEGLVQRIPPARPPARFENRVGDDRRHLSGRTCNRMGDVHGAAGDTPFLTAADDLGYENDEAEAVHWGRDPKCVATTSVFEG